MTETPIIGVLAQEAYLVSKPYPDAHSFIAASFVKFVEASGARVLPIWIGQNDSYYERVVNYTNGVLLPGGGVYFNESGGYGEATAQIYRVAKQLNDNGNYYPILGICLGMEAMLFAAAGEDIRGNCESVDVALPLNFDAAYNTSRLYSNAPNDLISNLQTKNLTYNFHRYCIFEKTMKEYNMLNDWKVLSRNTDKYNVEFVSSMEHVKYPFYGTQYHPEKNAYEFKHKTAIPHSVDAIEMSQYLSNFFVKEARKNTNKFPSEEMELNSLIYNFDVTFTQNKTSYEQIYLFKKEDYSRCLLL